MDLADKTDEEVVVLVRGGDVDAFGTIVERYEQKLLRYARRFLFGADDAKDLVQDVFIKAYANLQSFDVSRRFSPWLYRVAHNEFLNVIKSRRGKETFSLFDIDILFPHPIAQETADARANSQEIRDWMEKSLKSLDAKYREPLVLYYFEEMSYQEVADILQIPVSTVGVRLGRGRALLKKSIGRDE
ncbi:MAG TPA: sigma-70 family RNA polymerase sigma factor [Candidatus Paceibacterota bacterium]